MQGRERHRDGRVCWGWEGAGRHPGRAALKWWQDEVLEGEQRDVPGKALGGDKESWSCAGMGNTGTSRGEMVGELLEESGRCPGVREAAGGAWAGQVAAPQGGEWPLLWSLFPPRCRGVGCGCSLCPAGSRLFPASTERIRGGDEGVWWLKEGVLSVLL